MKQFVAMLNGPHDADGNRRHNRIDTAVSRALELRLPLLVVGDSNHGSDVRYYCEYARKQGVLEVVGLHRNLANTLIDAYAIADHVSPFAASETSGPTIHLVTDYWHLPRSLVFLHAVLKERIGTFRIVAVPALGFDPPAEIVLGEVKGINDFLSGDYGLHNAPHPPFGKPAELAHFS